MGALAESLAARPQNAAGRRLGLLRFSLPFLLFQLIVWVLPPPVAIFPDVDLLDASWRILLTDAFLRGAQFGRDFIYTFGPWGFVAEPQGDPRIWPWLIAARLLIAAALVLGVCLIALRRIRARVPRALFVTWIMLFADPTSVVPVVLLAITSLPSAQNDRFSRLTLHLLALACALITWMKFTSFVIVAALIGTLALQDIFRRRRPLLALEITATAFAFWLLARQSPLGLPAFLHGALAAAASYSGAMFRGGPYPELPAVSALLLAAALPAAFIVHRMRLWFFWPSLAWIALVFFLCLKEAFVRHDSFHLWMGLVDALIPSALILICRAGYFDPPCARFLTRICAGAVVVLSIFLTGIQIPGVAGFERFQRLTRNMDSLRALLSGHSPSSDYRRHLAEFARVKPLRRVDGTAAFFPDDEALLFGNGIRADLPPMPQSFEAYNSYLSGRNEAFYRSQRRPDYVFFDVHPIDGRYPAVTDPLSWLALLECYSPDGYSGSYLVLRSATCGDSSLEPVSKSAARAGEVVSVPDGKGFPVWAEIDVRPNPVGSLLAFLARPASTLLSIETVAGRHLYALPAETARAGFLLSPQILTPGVFASLYNSETADPATTVRSIAVVQSDRGRKLSRPIISFRFYRLRLTHR